MAIAEIAVSCVTFVGVSKGAKSTDQGTNPEIQHDGNPSEVVNEDDAQHWKHKILPKFGEVKGEYKKVVLGCLISTICAGILQNAIFSLCAFVLLEGKINTEFLRYI